MSLSKRKEICQTWVAVKRQCKLEQLCEGRTRPSWRRTLPARGRVQLRTSLRFQFLPCFLVLAAMDDIAELPFECSQYFLRNRFLMVGPFRSIPEP